jgi:hypothetical protein
MTLIVKDYAVIRKADNTAFRGLSVLMFIPEIYLGSASGEIRPENPRRQCSKSAPSALKSAFSAFVFWQYLLYFYSLFRLI